MKTFLNILSGHKHFTAMSFCQILGFYLRTEFNSDDKNCSRQKKRKERKKDKQTKNINKQ
jgi:hypothetical protein